jgi:hypothetical protein
VRPEIPPAVEEVVLHALEPDVHARPQSALELREALAHPASVVFRDRAARARSRPRSSRRIRTLVQVATAGAGYALLLWALSRLR